MLYIAFIFSLFINAPAVQQPGVTHLTGVYQGRTLFIQNPYDPETRTFCIQSIRLNNRELRINYRISALKLDFDGFDQNVPVNILIQHKDSCNPVIINPDAINFHGVFSFREVSFADSAIIWKTVGEKSKSHFVLEKYAGGIWLEEDTVQAKALFGGSEYVYFPRLEEGPVKVRIKYTTPNGKFLYSRELDFHYYPDPVTFKPHVAHDKLTLSRNSTYEIFDGGGSLVQSGQDIVIDIKTLPRGDYVIYFNGKDPGVFRKE